MYRCRSAGINDSQYDIFVIQIHRIVALLSPTPTTPPNYDALPTVSIQLNLHIFRHLYYEPKQTLSACAVRQRRRKTGAADFALTTFQRESRLSTCRPSSLLEGREVIP